MSERFRVSGPNIIHEQFDDEVVIVNLTTGSYYSAEKTGASIWSLILQNKSKDEILAQFANEYPADLGEIEHGISSFLSELIQESLIAQDGSSPGASVESRPSADSNRAKSFDKPSLQKYTDMEELLLLDPIHEVDEMGWPNAKQVDPSTLSKRTR